MELSGEARHYEELLSKWGTPVPWERKAEVASSTAEDLRKWARNCRSRAAYALGRGNGDGFFEARVNWYGSRAKWLEEQADLRETSSAVKPTQSPPMKRKVDAIRPMDPYPKMRRLTDSAVMPTVGGWPSANHSTVDGPTPNGTLSGEKEDSSSILKTPPPSHSEAIDSLAVIKESY